jgi:hypothetical protein
MFWLRGHRVYALSRSQLRTSGRDIHVADPRGGRARDDSYILEFASVPDTLADVLKLTAPKPPG